MYVVAKEVKWLVVPCNVRHNRRPVGSLGDSGCLVLVGSVGVAAGRTAAPPAVALAIVGVGECPSGGLGFFGAVAAACGVLFAAVPSVKTARRRLKRTPAVVQQCARATIPLGIVCQYYYPIGVNSHVG